MSDKLKAYADRYDQAMREAARETLKICDKMTGTRYVTLPGASRWTRLKVWLKNRMHF